MLLVGRRWAPHVSGKGKNPLLPHQKFQNLTPNSTTSLFLTPNSRPLQNLTPRSRILSRKGTHPPYYIIFPPSVTILSCEETKIPLLMCVATFLSVRKVVPTLTSMSVEIYLLMAGAKQLGDTRFILVPAGAVHPAGVCSRHYIALHRDACRGELQARRERRGGL
jgi:hypothetical protein